MPDIILFGVPPVALIFGLAAGVTAAEQVIALIRRVLFVVVGLFTLDINVACVVARMQVEGGIRDVILQVAILLGFYAIFAFFVGVALAFRAGHRRTGVLTALAALSPIPIFLIAAAIQRVI